MDVYEKFFPKDPYPELQLWDKKGFQIFWRNALNRQNNIDLKQIDEKVRSIAENFSLLKKNFMYDIVLSDEKSQKMIQIGCFIDHISMDEQYQKARKDFDGSSLYFKEADRISNDFKIKKSQLAKKLVTTLQDLSEILEFLENHPNYKVFLMDRHTESLI